MEGPSLEGRTMWKPVRSRSSRSRFPYPWGRVVLLTLPMAGLLSALLFVQSPKPHVPPDPPPTKPSVPEPAPQPPPNKPEPALEPVLESGCPVGCTIPTPECTIKGNISFRTGERIYHLPGQSFYEKTVISPEEGERWFCNEEEARANGWRRTKR
jgi:hypothetical protein